jgi:hypothetical protein
LTASRRFVAVTSFFGRSGPTCPGISITVNPAEKIGCLVKGITALTEQLSNSPTELPFF